MARILIAERIKRRKERQHHVASYKAINGIMSELIEGLKRRLPAELETGQMNTSVRLLSSKDLSSKVGGNVVGLYLYRVLVDTHGRNRYLHPNTDGKRTPQPELPVNLHFLLIVYGTSPENEMDLLSWAMQQFSGAVMLDVGHLREIDPSWSAEETIQVTNEDLSTEDLFRIWEVLKADYTVCVPYVAKTVRLLPDPLITEGEPVKTRVFEAGEQHED